MINSIGTLSILKIDRVLCFLNQLHFKRIKIFFQDFYFTSTQDLQQQGTAAPLLYSGKIKSTDFTSLLNRVPRVSACHRFLSVLACLCAMRAFVLWRASVPSCQRVMACLRVCVPTCHDVPSCQRAYVPLKLLRARVPSNFRCAIHILACHPYFGVPSKFRSAIQISACHSIFGVPS